MKDIVIVGAGGFGREVAWLIEDINKKEDSWNILGYIDDNASNHGKVLNNVKILGGFQWLEENPKREEIYFVCAVGNPITKELLVRRCETLGLKPATLIHPSVIMSNYNTIGEGSIICAGNIITVNVEIGNHVIVNLDCTIGHDAVIKDYCTILPSVNVSGNTLIEKLSEIGTGTQIIQGIKIGEETIVGAGAAVVKDLPGKCTAVGIPAKVIKASN